MKYVISTKLNILSKSNEPTFLNIRSWQVIGLTLGITLVGDLVPDWHVPSEESLSDHRYICFKIESQVFVTVIYRNRKETDWAGYRQDLSALIGGISKNILSRLDLEMAAVECSNPFSCPTITTGDMLMHQGKFLGGP
jgi:hypothetical protein